MRRWVTFYVLVIYLVGDWQVIISCMVFVLIIDIWMFLCGQEMKFGWQIVLGSIIGFFGAAFGSVGGVGGGGIFVPMLSLVIGFDPKSATAISKCKKPLNLLCEKGDLCFYAALPHHRERKTFLIRLIRVWGEVEDRGGKVTKLLNLLLNWFKIQFT